MGSIQARSKTIVLVAAVADNGVIGANNDIPWHLPEDFKHFRAVTMKQTLLMGRSTFDSIGRPLPGRETIVITRNANWRHAGVRVAHSVQSAIDLAEETPGRDTIVVGGSHIYAATISAAHMQIISRIQGNPAGDALYPPWDETEWMRTTTDHRDGFDIEYWHRRPREERSVRVQFNERDIESWWNSDWADRLARAVARQKRLSDEAGAINWTAVHQAAMRVIVEAAEDAVRRGPDSAAGSARQVRLSRHLSVQDLNALQGALLHWSDFVAPRARNAP